MRKFCVLFLLFVSSAFAENNKPLKHSFTYIKLGIGSVLDSQSDAVLPMLALGKRFQYGFMGVDLSASYMSKELKSGAKQRYWSVPKILWLLFLQPRWNWSFYFGVGASYGNIKATCLKRIAKMQVLETKSFSGILAEGAFGIEIASKQKVKSFIEFNGSYPLASSKESEERIDLPAISVGVGIAF